MNSLSELNYYIPIPFPQGKAPKLRLTSQETALQSFLTVNRLASAAPVLWETLKERCRADQRTPTQRREWLQFRHGAITKRVACACSSLSAPALIKALQEVTEANLLRDDFLGGVDALCTLRRDQASAPTPNAQVQAEPAGAPEPNLKAPSKPRSRVAHKPSKWSKLRKMRVTLG